MARMQVRLEEQARVIEQQAALIHNFQQHRDGPGVVQQPPLVRPEPLCDRFYKMKPKAFEGSIDPLDAEEWLSSIQVIVEFMELNDQERIICASYMMKKEARYWWESVKARRTVSDMTWEDFKTEFNRKFFNPTAMSAQQTEFLNLQQGDMTVAEAVRKFEQLARLCPYLVPTEEQRARRMLEMFRPEISLSIESIGGQPTTTTECTERAYRAEHRWNQIKERRAKAREDKKKRNRQSDTGASQVQKKRKGNFPKADSSAVKKETATTTGCPKCGRNHYGECKQGTNICFRCGKSGHFARNCTTPRNVEDPESQEQPLLNMIQSKLVDPTQSQGKSVVSEPPLRFYAYSKGGQGAGDPN
ncbi:hypothetical protein UlMin_040016 [Ulmus minor]